MRLIGLEEHWCPRELFEEKSSPEYKAMAGVRRLFSSQQLEEIYALISDIGNARTGLLDKLGIS